jgi:hypothetical protein
MEHSRGRWKRAPHPVVFLPTAIWVLDQAEEAHVGYVVLKTQNGSCPALIHYEEELDEAE